MTRMLTGCFTLAVDGDTVNPYRSARLPEWLNPSSCRRTYEYAFAKQAKGHKGEAKMKIKLIPSRRSIGECPKQCGRRDAELNYPGGRVIEVSCKKCGRFKTAEPRPTFTRE